MTKLTSIIPDIIKMAPFSMVEPKSMILEKAYNIIECPVENAAHHLFYAVVSDCSDC